MAERFMAPGQAPDAARFATRSDTLQLFSHDIRSAMSDVIGGPATLVTLRVAALPAQGLALTIRDHGPGF